MSGLTPPTQGHRSFCDLGFPTSELCRLELHEFDVDAHSCRLRPIVHQADKRLEITNDPIDASLEPRLTRVIVLRADHDAQAELGAMKELGGRCHIDFESFVSIESFPAA